MRPYSLVFVLSITMYLFSPAVLAWWNAPNALWYRPYLLWLIIVVIIFMLQRRTDSDEL